MKLFDVYSLLDMEPVRGEGAYLWDKNGVEYLDFYGGHAVISIGHTHPHYVAKISEQLSKIGFYSNAVINSLQVELAEKLGPLTGYPDYELFLCNSGAEANENAVKLASLQRAVPVCWLCTVHSTAAQAWLWLCRITLQFKHP